MYPNAPRTCSPAVIAAIKYCEAPGRQLFEACEMDTSDHGVGGAARLHHIGEIARQTHLSLRTLRYWEEVGLVRPSGRTAGGFRLYSDDELARVELVRAMKPADLTIEELRDMADLVDEIKLHRESGGGHPRAEAVARLEELIGRIRSRCEVLRGRLDAAEAATLELEQLIDDSTARRPPAMPLDLDRGKGSIA